MEIVKPDITLEEAKALVLEYRYNYFNLPEELQNNYHLALLTASTMRVMGFNSHEVSTAFSYYDQLPSNILEDKNFNSDYRRIERIATSHKEKPLDEGLSYFYSDASNRAKQRILTHYPLKQKQG